MTTGANKPLLHDVQVAAMIALAASDHGWLEDSNYRSRIDSRTWKVLERLGLVETEARKAVARWDSPRRGYVLTPAGSGWIVDNVKELVEAKRKARVDRYRETLMSRLVEACDFIIPLELTTPRIRIGDEVEPYGHLTLAGCDLIRQTLAEWRAGPPPALAWRGVARGELAGDLAGGRRAGRAHAEGRGRGGDRWLSRRRSS